MQLILISFIYLLAENEEAGQWKDDIGPKEGLAGRAPAGAPWTPQADATAPLPLLLTASLLPQETWL